MPIWSLGRIQKLEHDPIIGNTRRDLLLRNIRRDLINRQLQEEVTLDTSQVEMRSLLVGTGGGRGAL